jgi:hypothetical protein
VSDVLINVSTPVIRQIVVLPGMFQDILEEARRNRYASVIALHSMVLMLLVEIVRQLKTVATEKVELLYSPVPLRLSIISAIMENFPRRSMKLLGQWV